MTLMGDDGDDLDDGGDYVNGGDGVDEDIHDDGGGNDDWA